MEQVAELSKRYAKGLEFYDQGLLIDALTEFEAVLKTANPASPESKLSGYYIGEAHARLAEESLLRGASENAERHLRDAISSNPKFPDLHYRLAQIMADRGEVTEAMAELQEALKLNPRYSKAMLLLGIFAYQSGEYGAGIKHIQHACDFQPRYATQLLEEAIDADKRKDHDNALQLFWSISDMNVDDIAFHLDMGKKHYREGDYRGAAEAFEQALSLNSTYPDIRNWYGLALMGCGQTEKALQEFETALETNANYMGAIINAGVACDMMGRRDDAKAYYRRALEIDSENVEARGRLAHGNKLN